MLNQKTRRVAGLSFLAIGLLCSCAARADIYSFVDDNGVTHFSNVPDDARYALFQKQPSSTVENASGSFDVISMSSRQREIALAGLIDQTARRRAVHPALLRAVVAAESAFDARAVSRAGAQGLMQLHPDTARRYGVANPFDAAENLEGGAHYLSDLLRRYNNDLTLTLAAYNAGEEAVERYGRHIPPYAETRAYVPTVLRLYRKYLMQAAS
jgi:soluble lytic murein transglycosylase-like protein